MMLRLRLIQMKINSCLWVKKKNKNFQFHFLLFLKKLNWNENNSLNWKQFFELNELKTKTKKNNAKLDEWIKYLFK